MSGPEVPGSGPAPLNAAGVAAANDGRTWWGRAWLEALEQRAQLDPKAAPGSDTRVDARAALAAPPRDRPVPFPPVPPISVPSTL